MIPRSPLIDFAEKYYQLGTEAAISGMFRILNSPWLAEPAAALCDPRVMIVTLQLAAQMGKNLLAEMFIGYIVKHAPGNVLVYCQTDEDAHDFAEDRVLKRVRHLPILAPLWPDTHAAKRKDEASLAHMYMKFLGANESNLQGKSAKYVLKDELHLWTKGMSDQADDRCSAFWDRKILNTSTAGDEGSEQQLAFDAGTQEEWNFACPECKRLVRPRWSEKPRILVWEANDLTKPQGKAWNFQEVRKTVKFMCPHEGCNCELRDDFNTRIEMNRLGAYIVGNPSAPSDNRSFTASQLAAPWVTWEEIVERWIKAIERQKTGDLTLLRNFIIKRLAQTWENRVSGGTQAIVTGGYSIADAFRWDEEDARFMTVDVQSKHGRHMWAVVRAWNKEGSSRLVAALRCNTWGEVEDMRKVYGVLPRRVGVDARHEGKEVREVCARNGWHWLMADETRIHYSHRIPGTNMTIQKPFGEKNRIDVFSGTRQQGTLFSEGFHFSKNWARQTLTNRLLGQGSRWELPDDVHGLIFEGTNKKQTDYLSQLNSWVLKSKLNPRTGATETGWHQVYADDHLRACEEMNLVMAALFGIVPSELSEDTRTGAAA
jgi:hypothetical protein